ncbi:MAG: alanine--tRNA ligase-related protein [Patescibacteria group bacterium]
MTQTKLLYMEDSYKLQDMAQFTDITQTEGGKTALILDQTIFYPQGGGQPYDTGTISQGSNEFKVDEVRFKDGIVYHVGNFTRGLIEKCVQVTLTVDEPRRKFNRRNHTAGHLIDVAVKNLGLSLTPAKGFHFPEGAYVEYVGLMDEAQKEELRVKIEIEVNRLVQLKLPMTAKQITFDELKELCDFVPEYLPKDKPIRIEKIGDYKAHPCGGTHVSNTEEVGRVTIEKLKSKSGNTRVSYKIT